MTLHATEEQTRNFYNNAIIVIFYNNQQTLLLKLVVTCRWTTIPWFSLYARLLQKTKKKKPIPIDSPDSTSKQSLLI